MDTRKSIFKGLVFLIAASGIMCSSCTSYLDVDPELGITEKDVFGTYKNFNAFFNKVYSDAWNGSIDNESGCVDWRWCVAQIVDRSKNRFSFVCTTDIGDTGRWGSIIQSLYPVQMTETIAEQYTTMRVPISEALYKVIRISNMALEHIDDVKNIEKDDKEDLIGQAYFVRAICHLAIVRFMGGMPYITKSLSGDDEWDIVRPSAHECYLLCAQDFYDAYIHLEKAGKMRRDAFPGEVGHLDVSDINKPNGCAALALRARCLLYAASPLNNTEGLKDWEAAAEAAALAIEKAEENEFAMLPLEEYKSNFIEKYWTNESLLSYPVGDFKNNSDFNDGIYTTVQAPGQSKASGFCPTQNCVDMFETIYGDPLYTGEERAAAIAAGHYNPQKPYEGLDPRFYLDIIYDGATTKYSNEPIKFYYDPATHSYPTTSFKTPDNSAYKHVFGCDWEMNAKTSSPGVCVTGYLEYKLWRGDLGVSSSTSYKHSEPIIRMAELYLNFAEAANEAYGPDFRPEGSDYTAVEAINIVRERAHMPEVKAEFTVSREAFRERIRNERNVELLFEGNHYYFDIRRWMIAKERLSAPIYGMYSEKVAVSSEYPLGVRYERRLLPENRQKKWKDSMYWWPLPSSEANKMTNFVNNEFWN